MALGDGWYVVSGIAHSEVDCVVIIVQSEIVRGDAHMEMDRWTVLPSLPD